MARLLFNNVDFVVFFHDFPGGCCKLDATKDLELLFAHVCL